MQSCGIDDSEKLALFQVAAAVIHLGELELVEVQEAAVTVKATASLTR